MAEARVVGIDLGTTNSLVAFMQDETPVVIPGENAAGVALGEAEEYLIFHWLLDVLQTAGSVSRSPS